MATLTVYPDAHAETDSFDGRVSYNNDAGELWATIIAQTTANLMSDTGTTNHATLIEGHASTNNRWTTVARGLFLFKTSSLTAAAVISAAVVSLFGQAKADGLSAAPNLNIYSSNPASNTGVTNTDFGGIGSTPFCDTPVTYAGFSTAAYNDFALNAAGLAAIAKTGITKFGTRNASYDVAASAPPWVAGGVSRLTVYNADQAGTTNDPKLVVTYTIPGVLAGASAGSASCTGVLTASGTLVGTAAGIAAATGIVKGAGKLSGVSSGVAALDAILKGIGKLAGISAGLATATGTVKGAGALVGTSAGAATCTGTLTLPPGALTGTAAGSSTAIGILKGAGKLSGTSAAAASCTGTLTGLGSLTGLASGMTVVTSTLKGSGKLIGQSAGLTALIGVLKGAGKLIGSSVGFASVSGTLASLITDFHTDVSISDRILHECAVSDAVNHHCIVSDALLYDCTISDRGLA